VISFFADPRPDELLYSCCARFAQRIKFPNQVTAARKLLGGKNPAAIIDLPTRISHLISVLPSNHQYTADLFIDRNTHHPYYVAFLPSERAVLLREDMRGSNGQHIRERLGITAGRLSHPCYLRFCPICVEEDREKWGWTYWHRVHQITGVEVCSTHAVFLQMSNVPWVHPTGMFYPAEKTLETISPPKHVAPSKRSDSILMEIASATEWLLNWHGPYPGLETLCKRYYNLLLERGYAYHNGRIRATKLLENFTGFYPTGLLEKLQSPVNDRAKGWLLHFIPKNRITIVQHPLRHLLLMIFLRITPEQVFVAFNENKPFGDGPWPCLNQASEHFEQLCVKDHHVTDNLVRGKRGRPQGVFSCECGFAYCRVGPDTSSEDRLRLDSVQTYGFTWEEKLREMWGRTCLSLREVALNLGVSELTVVRHAIRLCLPMNIPGARQVRGYERYRKYRKTRQEALESYKQEWMLVRETNPDATRNELMKFANFLYLWLRKNAPEWIESHLPPAIKERPKKNLIQWKSKDLKLATKIRSKANMIRNHPGRPVRVSITALIREVGHRAWIEKQLNKLPLTAKALAESLESVESYLLRRVKWAQECYMLEGMRPTRYQLASRAGTRNKTGRGQHVQCAIDAAMVRLSQQPEYKRNNQMESGYLDKVDVS
jgi:hypothetical protein